MRRSQTWIIAYGIILTLTFLAAQWGSRIVTVFSESILPERKHIIVIDPGHGGIDGGATSCTGKLESSFNLEISLRLNDLFHFLGYPTRMIRTEDISVYKSGETIAQKKVSDLKERVRVINDTKNALLISIHQNIFPDGRYSGAQVFYAPNPGSQALAKELQAALIQNVNSGSKRQEKKSTKVYLMEHISCPGVLIECGFLSNPQEENKLKTVKYQQELCSVIATTVSRHLSNA